MRLDGRIILVDQWQPSAHLSAAPGAAAAFSRSSFSLLGPNISRGVSAVLCSVCLPPNPSNQITQITRDIWRWRWRSSLSSNYCVAGADFPERGRWCNGSPVCDSVGCSVSVL